MGPLLIPMLSGGLVFGHTGEENGFGCLVIGQGLQDLSLFGFQVTGSSEEGVGSGLKDTGNTAENNS